MDESDIVLTAGKKFGVDEALVIYTSKIDVKESVPIYCQYGCEHFQKYWTCPPASIPIEKTRELLREFKRAILVIGEQGKMELKKFKEAMWEIEKTLKLNNFKKAMGLTMGPCNWCEKCTYPKKPCIHPEKHRPSLEGMGIDVAGTAKKYKKNIEQEIGNIRFPSIGIVLLD